MKSLDMVEEFGFQIVKSVSSIEDVPAPYNRGRCYGHIAHPTYVTDFLVWVEQTPNSVLVARVRDTTYGSDRPYDKQIENAGKALYVFPGHELYDTEIPSYSVARIHQREEQSVIDALAAGTLHTGMIFRRNDNLCYSAGDYEGYFIARYNPKDIWEEVERMSIVAGSESNPGEAIIYQTREMRDAEIADYAREMNARDRLLRWQRFISEIHADIAYPYDVADGNGDNFVHHGWMTRSDGAGAYTVTDRASREAGVTYTLTDEGRRLMASPEAT